MRNFSLNDTQYSTGDVLEYWYLGSPQNGKKAIFLYDSKTSSDAMWIWTFEHGVHKALTKNWYVNEDHPMPGFALSAAASSGWPGIDWK